MYDYVFKHIVNFAIRNATTLTFELEKQQVNFSKQGNQEYQVV
jgi:hypothetical protein